MATNLPLKLYVEQKPIKDRLQSILGQRAPQFAAAIVQVVNRSSALQNCSPESIVGAAITAAVLDLSIDPNLGEAYIIPYGPQASFQLGYIGLTQLALRSGQYKRLGWQVVYEGQLKFYEELTGELELHNDLKTSDKVIGYAAKFVLVNGFERGEYWPVEKVKAHAERFSQAFKRGKQDSPWVTDFNRMATKTCLKHLLRVWGPKSIVMQKALATDEQVFRDLDTSVDVETAASDEAKKVEDKNEATKETIANVGSAIKIDTTSMRPTATAREEDNLPMDTPPAKPAEQTPVVAELVAMLEGVSFDDFKTFARTTCATDLDAVPGFQDLSPVFCQKVLTDCPKQLGKFIKIYKK